jgi:predicted O-linked N-acetylglucosamine transferase (SPINDLY family)
MNQAQPNGAAQLVNQAISLHQQGRIAEAEALYKSALEVDPRDFDALHMLGIVHAQRNQFAEAEALLRKALAVDKSVIPCWHNHGTLLAKLRRFDESVASYQSALKLNPNYPPIYSDLGNSLFALGRFQEALANYQTQLSFIPNHPDALVGCGNAQNEIGNYEEAAASFDKALAINAQHPNAWLGKGNVLYNRGLYDDARAAYDRALTLKADLADAWIGRGNVFANAKQFSEALTAFDKALSIDPDQPAGYCNRANVHFVKRRFSEALRDLDRAVALNPNYAEAWAGRGNVLVQLNQLRQAEKAFDRALTLKPTLGPAWAGQGQRLLALGRYQEALAAFDKAIALKPDEVGWLTNKIFALDFSPDASFAEHQAARTEWWRRFGETAASAPPARHGNSRDPKRRLVLGYVSADFRQHSAAFTFRPVLSHHDKAQFEIVCYSNNPHDDDVTPTFKSVADRWHDVAEIDDDELAQRIRADQIDILIDLSGHSGGNRLLTFARKPAPVQVTAWGHATGTGLSTIDYLLSDPVAIPEAVRHFFAEKIYDVPCVIATEPLPEGVSAPDPSVFKAGYCTFGVLNRTSKISDEAIRTWACILNDVPGSRLLMKDTSLDATPVMASLRERFAACGISSDRLEFLGSTPRQQHLDVYQRIDISLDPFPVNGGVSTWESLRMGVPMVTKLGQGLPSRTSGAILTSIGMSDWVARDADSYHAIAVQFARDADRLTKAREQLPSRIATSSSGDVMRYTRAVEAAYRDMWQSYCQST